MSSLSRVTFFLFLIYCTSAVTLFAQSPCQVIESLLAKDKIEEASQRLSDISSVNDADCLNNLGQVFLRKGDVNKAISAFEKALRNKSTDDQAATSLNQLAIAYKNIGNNAKAIDFMQQAMQLVKANGNKQQLAAAYNDYGLVLSGVDNDASLDNYTQALQLYQSLYKTEHESIVQSLINIGVVYRNMQFYGDAIHNFEEAQKIAHKIYSDHHPTKAFIYYNLGQTYFDMDNSQTALDFFKKSLNIYQSAFGDKHPDIARAYNRIGNVYNRDGAFEQALEYYQKALIANSTLQKPDLEQNPVFDSFLHAGTLLNSLYYKAQALEDYHFNFSLDFKDLKLSLSTLYTCDSLIDKIRQITTNEADKIAIGAVSAQVYENGVRISYAMADLSFKKDEYFNHAFYFAEKSKSAVLLQAISDASAKSYANIPIDLLQKEDFYKKEIAFYERKIAESDDNQQNNRDQLFQLRQQYEQFVAKLEKDYPEYYNLKYNVSIPSIEAIQSVLHENEALVSYFVADVTSRIYVFQISKSKLRVDNVNQTENFERYLSGFRNSIYFKESDIYQLTGEALYELLFPSAVPNKVDHLIIVPSGRLGTVPFEALLTESTKEKNFDYKTLPYLMRDYSVAYQYASTLFHQYALHRDSQQSPQAALLCAPVQFQTLQDLPGTGKEVEALSDILKTKGITPDVLLEANATESIFKTKPLKNYGYLHFATHGVVNEYSPELSRIYLREDDNKIDDGNLYSGEIYNLNLNAKLVTLSACETGLGKISKGEGIIGLSRALVYAGAQNLIVSLWKVADRSTSELMTDFYTKIGDQDFSTALRNAKLELLSGKYSQPYYWAPFILIGE